jgi:membrane-associated phospholipid phosphatase
MAEGSSRVRILALYALLPLVACGQLWSALEVAGVSLPAARIVLAIEAGIVLVSVAVAMRQPPEHRELAPFAGIGLGVFVFWAALYFGASRITQAPLARTFDEPVLAHLPMMPELTPIYLGVHVFGIVPFCVLPEVRMLRRHMLGAVLIVFLSAIAWVALPVRLDRPPVAPELHGFGVTLLRWVRSFDPTTNCFPSAHCAIAVYAAIGLRLGPSRTLFYWGIVTATLVCLSTVLTRQHYVADVASGGVLAGLAAYGTQRGARPRRDAR